MNRATRPPLRMVTRQEANEFLRRAGLGMVSDGGNSPYDESDVFRGGSGTDSGYSINAQTRLPQVIKPDIVLNLTSFATYPFALSRSSGNNGSVQIVPSNPRRTFLLVQNQDTSADMYLNFSSGAAVGSGILLIAGQGIFFDTDKGTPNNSVFVFMNSATAAPGVVVEGAPQS